MAAQLLRAGKLVAFPTETVYGLGADASSASAMARLYAIKGRPADHPVIVHFVDAAAAFTWAREIPEAARTLAARFWPGPLTLVLKRASHVGNFVTGGQDNVQAVAGGRFFKPGYTVFIRPLIDVKEVAPHQ